MTTNYTLRSEQVRANLLVYIRDLPLEPVMRITVKEYKKDKSLEQLGYLFGVVLPTICQHVEDSEGQHYTTDEAYSWFIDEYGEDRVVIINGKPKVTKRTASKMNTKQMSDFIERVIQHAAMNMGLAIPDADHA